MKFGKPIVYQCPSCGISMDKMTYMSYTIHPGMVHRYSDGYQTGRPPMIPELAKCPGCAALFFMHNLKGTESESYGSKNQKIKRPELEDFLPALKDAKTSEEKIIVRKGLWYAYNDLIRNNDEKFSPAELQGWEDNCTFLLELLLQQWEDKRLRFAREKIFMLHITIMELKRNLGQFAECLQGIKEAADLDVTYAWLEKHYETQCKKKNKFVFEFIAEKNPEKKEEDENTWNCGQSVKKAVRAVKNKCVLEISGRGPMKDFNTSPWNELDISMVKILEGISSIGDYAFANCKNLQYLELPKSLESIGNWAFCGCEQLKRLKIPDNVKHIGQFAFVHCNSLASLTLGRKLEYIGKYAFRKHNGYTPKLPWLENVTALMDDPVAITDNHFLHRGFSNSTLYVSESSLQKYMNAEVWKQFGTIQAIKDAELKEPDMKTQSALAEKLAQVKPDATIHIWIGNFESEEALNEYADNSQFEEEYYDHLLGKADAPTEICGFAADYSLDGDEAANLVDDLHWEYFTQESPILDLLNIGIPIDLDDVLEATKKKHPELKTGNAVIILTNWPDWEEDFDAAVENLKESGEAPQALYLGEFTLTEPEPDTDGQYEGLD